VRILRRLEYHNWEIISQDGQSLKAVFWKSARRVETVRCGFATDIRFRAGVFDAAW
jgi:hypothetical protein